MKFTVEIEKSVGFEVGHAYRLRIDGVDTGMAIGRRASLGPVRDVLVTLVQAQLVEALKQVDTVLKIGDRVRTLREGRENSYSKGAIGVIESELDSGVWVVQLENDRVAIAGRWLEDVNE